MAPEVISGKVYTEKADVFSFGIIMWEVASREPPYKSIIFLIKLLRYIWIIGKLRGYVK